MKRHWTINGRFLAQPMTGVQRYAREIVLALDGLIAGCRDLTGDLEVELVMPPGVKDVPPLLAISSCTAGSFGGHMWEQGVLPAHVRGGLLNLCNTGPLTITKQVVCIHDLNVRNFPQSYSLPFRAAYRMILPALGKTAAAIATVSHYSAGQLERYRIAPRDRIFVAPNGHEHAARWTPVHTDATRDAASAQTIVLIGSSAPHKNMSLVFGLADRLAEMGLRIAVVGGANPRVFNTVSSGRDNSNISWLGRLTDDNLAALLQDSLCLAFPSLEEGFGLPPLEAMAIGCPVVTSNRASMPEICGDAALFASPDDPDAWLACFGRLQQDRDLRRKLKVEGSIQAGRFSWSETAERYLGVMAVYDGIDTAGTAVLPPMKVIS